MRVKKVAAALLCAALISGMTGMTALAVVETKISSVSLVVEADMEVGQNIQDQEIEVTPKSDKYSAGEYEFLNTGFSWSEEDIPVVKVSIYAEDGYKFAVSKDKITLKGATFVDYSREDESHTLVITMQLPPLAEQTSAIEQAAWTSTTGVSWSQSTGAGSYEVKLYRDGKTVGTTKTTAGNSYDFSAAMTKAGTYFYRVRPVNRLKPENKGEWVESPSRYIDNDTAAAIYQNGSLRASGSRMNPDGGTETGMEPTPSPTGSRLTVHGTSLMSGDTWPPAGWTGTVSGITVTPLMVRCWSIRQRLTDIR